jgi:hypothetical protein
VIPTVIVLQEYCLLISHHPKHTESILHWVLLTVLGIKIEMENILIACCKSLRDIFGQVRAISRLLTWPGLVPRGPGHRYALVGYYDVYSHRVSVWI